MKKKKKISKNTKTGIIQKIEKIPVKYLAIAIFIFAIVLYARTISYDYVYCDDNLFCLKYEKQNEDLSNIYKSFTETLAYGSLYYRPILRITFILENQIAGIDPFIYHLTNVVFHACGSMLVFLVLMRLGYSKLPSFILGLLFTAHPVITPAATWISGRNDSLITIFLLLSFIYFIKYLNDKGGKSTQYLIIHLLLYAISLFTKETAVIFPFMSIAFILFFQKESLFDKRKYYIYAGWALLTLLWYILRNIAIGGFESPDEVGFAPLLEKYRVIFSLFSKIVIPFRLAPLSNHHWMTIAIGVTAFAGIGVFTYLSKKIDRSKVFFGLLWYLMFLFPSLAVMLFDDFFDYAEHRAYLLIVGFFIVLMEIFKVLNISFNKKVPFVIVSIVLMLFTAKAFVYQDKMENKFNFWTNIRKNFPKQQKAYIMLGEHYQKIDSLRHALLYYKRAFRLGEPTYNLYVNTSAIHLKNKNYAEAEKYARLAIKMDSIGHTALYNLAKSLTGLRRYKEATPYYIRAIQRNNKESWHIDLGNNYFFGGNYTKAVETYEQALLNLKDRSNLGAIYSNLGSSYANLQENDKAEENFLKALPISNNGEIALLNIILFYSLNKVDPDKAFAYAKQYRQMGYKMSPDIEKLLNSLEKKK